MVLDKAFIYITDFALNSINKTNQRLIYNDPYLRFIIITKF